MRSPIWSPHTAMLSASAAKLRFAGGYAGIAVSCRVGGLQGRLCGPGFPVGGMALVACTHDAWRSEEHTSELQSRQYLACRLLHEKKTSLNRSGVAAISAPGRGGQRASPA